jgi:hypothetical protein
MVDLLNVCEKQTPGIQRKTAFKRKILPETTADTRGLTTANNCRFGFVQQAC